jgi:predicted transcriptional regulator of viral defense system
MDGMRYSKLLDIVGNDPVFETALLTVGDTSPYQAQRRLADWKKSGKVNPLRRGLFVLPKPKRAIEPHPFVIANRLVHGSYISLEMALSYFGLIPEYAAVVTCVTTGRPVVRKNEFGRFQYRHIHPRYFFGIEYRLIMNNQYAFIAYPEKALLDMIYLRTDGDSAGFIRSLRLQNLEQIDIERLQKFASRFDKPKIRRASEIIRKFVELETSEYQPL